MKRRKARGGERSKNSVVRTTARPLLPLPFGKGEGRGEGLPGDARTLLTISNRQRTRPINVRQVRQIIRALLDEMVELNQYELGINLVGANEMTQINETFLQHAGSTDVITFDYLDLRPQTSGFRPPSVYAELFICVDEAVAQARRFRTTWQSEIIRYVIHGILHLLGHDDHRPAARRKMKREEARLLKQLGTRFPLSQLDRNPRLRP
jgi:probable rRNA maturation factor